MVTTLNFFKLPLEARFVRSIGTLGRRSVLCLLATANFTSSYDLLVQVSNLKSLSSEHLAHLKRSFLRCSVLRGNLQLDYLPLLRVQSDCCNQFENGDWTITFSLCFCFFTIPLCLTDELKQQRN